MADDAAAPAFTNDPSDPSTWSPDFAAQLQAGIAKRAADEAIAASKIQLALLQPCAFVLSSAWSDQAATVKSLAKAADDDLLVSWGNNLATNMTAFANEFRQRFAQSGGVVPTAP